MGGGIIEALMGEGLRQRGSSRVESERKREVLAVARESHDLINVIAVSIH
jgi:hypothetical protein